MSIKLKINAKMLLYILGLTALIYIGSLGYISFKLYKVSSENASVISHTVAIENANDAKRSLNEYLEASSTLSTAFSKVHQISEENRRAYVLDVMQDIIKSNSNFLSVWSMWEPSTIDALDAQSIGTPGSTYIGSFSPGLYRDGDKIKLEENNGTELFMGEYYTLVKDCQCERLLEPYMYSYTGDSTQAILQTNMVSPIIIDGTFCGVVGIDAPLSYFQEKFEAVKPLETGHVFLISNKGIIVAGPDANFVNKPFSSFSESLNTKYSILDKISTGTDFEFYDKNPFNNEKSLFLFKSLYIGDSPVPWSYCVSIPTKTIYYQAMRSITNTLVVGILGIIALSIVIGIFSRSLAKPLVKINKVLKELAKGNIDKSEKVAHVTHDEIGDLGLVVNKLFDGLNSAAEFANKIDEGDLNAKYELLGHNDELGQSLLEMQKSLIFAKNEEDKKKLKDANRNWVTHGLAKFGEIIRKDNNDMGKFSLNVIGELVNYMEVSQAAIYITENVDNDGTMEEEFVLKAAVAYGKPVMLSKSVKKGNELIGRAADEGKIIHLKDLPENYVELSPGRKNLKRPTHLLISPLSINELTYGVVEILGYKPFENHHIDFVEKLSENVASVISSVKTNIQTAKLLEQSQFQADELAQHEEEMRQNLEEMQATQEEAMKRESSLQSYIHALNKSLMVAELDIKGRIIEMSPHMTSTYGITLERIQGKYFDGFVAQNEETRAAFNQFWDEVISNGRGRRVHIVKQRNKELILVEEYIVLEQERSMPRILIISIDRTNERTLFNKLKEEKKAHKIS